MKKFGFALLAVAGLAAAANAQTVEYRWVAATTSAGNGGLGNQTAAGAVSGSNIVVNGAYRQRFELQARVVGAPSGLASVEGAVAATAVGATDSVIENYKATGAITAGLGRLSPFTFGNDDAKASNNGIAIDAPNGPVQVDGIAGVSGAINPTAARTWQPDGSAIPAPPAALGASPTWISVYRILVDVTALQLDGSVVTVAFNPSRAFSVDHWATTPDVVPNPNDGGDAVDFSYVAATAQLQAAGAPTSFTLTLAPAPASAALLGLGGLVAARRRRA